MLTVTKDMVLPTTITGSYPKPAWYTENLQGRPFKVAMGDSLFREQYLDTVATIIREQETAGLDIVTDGDARFDLSVGGKHWFFYVIERLGGLAGRRDLAPGWSDDYGMRPGHILFEIQEASQAPVVVDKLSRGPLELSAIWKEAQRMTEKPVKIGTISAQCLASMLWNDHYADDHELILDLSDLMNQEFHEMVSAGCRIIQIEEPRHHWSVMSGEATDKELAFLTEALNREIKGLDAEIWVHTCWGNPNQQRFFWETPSYERALPHLMQIDADVLTFECASSNGRDIEAIGRIDTDKKIAIGVISHTNTVVEPPEVVADMIRRALDHIPPERLVLSTDCGFGREGLSRRIAFYKCVSLVKGANLVRRELGLPEVPIRGADPRFAWGGNTRE